MSKDYVSKELARKLQEKGYPLKKVYRQDGAPLFYDLPQDHPDWSQCDAWYLPSISQVLKWLREEKNLYIRIELCKGIYFYNVFDTVEYLEDWTHKSYCIGEDGNESYEESCISAINYVIDNLI